MAEYWIDPESGSDAAAGTELAPWRLIPGQVGANAVGANDILNIKNGTTSNGGTITPPANGLLYRGYGLAGNILQIKTPAVDPNEVEQISVVREAGVHEGMWRLNMRDAGSSVGLSVANARSGVVVEDMHVFSNSQSGNLVNIGTSGATSANGGFTIRRSLIEGSGDAGLNIYKFNAAAEYVKIIYTMTDCVKIIATTANSVRTGSVDSFSRMDLEYCNHDYTGSPAGVGGGDLFQVVADNAGSGYYEGKLTLRDTYMEKGGQEPNADGKQALLFHDGLNGFTFRNIHIFGAVPEAQISVMVGCLRGNVLLENIVFSGYAQSLSPVRHRSGNTPIGTQLMSATAVLTLRNIVANISSTASTFYDAAESNETLSMDGTLTIENCTVRGSFVPTLSYSADVSLQGGNTTYGAGFKLNLRNNIFDTGNTKLKLPTGTAGDADYAVKNNWFRPGNSFYIGSTEYTTLAAFAAAHAPATGNLDGALALDPDSLAPSSASSPQVGSGLHIEYSRDARKTMRYNPPCMGAYEFIRPRPVL